MTTTTQNTQTNQNQSKGVQMNALVRHITSQNSFQELLLSFSNGALFSYKTKEGKVKTFSKATQSSLRAIMLNKSEFFEELSYFTISEFLKLIYKPSFRKDEFYNGGDRQTVYQVLSAKVHQKLIKVQLATIPSLDGKLAITKSISIKGYRFAVHFVSLIIRFLTQSKLVNRETNFTGEKGKVMYRLSESIVNYIKINDLYKLFIKEQVQKGFRSKPSVYNSNNYWDYTSKVYTGHYFKYRPEQNKSFVDLLNKLNQQEYELIPSIWNNADLLKKIAMEIANFDIEKVAMMNTNDRISAEASFSAVVNEIRYLRELTKDGSPIFINWSYGPDNGRIYCKSGNFGFQKGWINHLFQFKNKQKLNKVGKAIITDLYYKAKNDYLADPDNVRKEVIYKVYKSAYTDGVIKNKAIGIMVEVDQKASGSMMQGIALRSKAVLKYTGGLLNYNIKDYSKANAEDLYRYMIAGLHIKVNGVPFSLDSIEPATKRDLVKKAYNPFQYGSGQKAMTNDLRNYLLSIGVIKSNDSVTFDYKAWENRFASIYPGLVSLRNLLLNAGSYLDTKHIEFTAPDGFKCAITSLNKEPVEVRFTGVIDTEISMSIKDIDAEYLGVRLVGAFSHHLDSTVLRNTLKQAFDKGIQVIPVHDAFMIHANDYKEFSKLYYNSVNELYNSDILVNFLSQVFSKQHLNSKSKYLFTDKVISNMAKDIIADDSIEIKGGLFLD